MDSVKIFGEQEFAFRIPSILASILCCWLVYLLTAELTGDTLAAAFGFLILLSTLPFFTIGREMRLDPAVVAAILAALYFFIKSWRKEKFLLFVLPAISVGFLFKSVIALLAVPIILLYATVYDQWEYLRSRYFWCGALLALLIWAPWHIVETLHFGQAFWNNYIGTQVLTRASSSFTGTDNWWDYLIVMAWYVPWNLLLLIELFTLGILAWRRREGQSVTSLPMLLPLVIAAGIVALFTAAKTHLGPYIMPAFPFFALSIALGFNTIAAISRRMKAIFSLLMLIGVLGGFVACFFFIDNRMTPYSYDEQAIGEIYRARSIGPGPLYTLAWPVLETLNYYGDTSAKFIGSGPAQEISAPFYLVVAGAEESNFMYDDHGTIRSLSPYIVLLYKGRTMALLYMMRSLEIPTSTPAVLPI